MAEDTRQEDRTEAATPRRLQKAREEGNVPVSREIQGLAGLAAVTLMMALGAGGAAQELATRLAAFLAHAHVSRLAGSEGSRQAWNALLHAVAPFVLAALLAGGAATLIQTGFLLHGAGLRPDFKRLSPRAGLHRLFGLENLVEGGKSLAKVIVLGLVIWRVLRAELPRLMLAPRWDPQILLFHTLRPALRVLFAVLAVQAAIALLDLFWVRLHYTRQLKMSRQDLREEMKDIEGDPRIKARLKQLRLQRARKRMMAAVPKATVVITNPTHYAVALVYDRGKHAAPRLVAKGVDSLAARIREVAQEHNVPLVANPPLAHALYRIELDAEIPAEHYQAVAEIIAYVWRLGQRSAGMRAAA